jgi:hypothetical protein
VRCPLCEALIDGWSKTVRDREGDAFPVCSPCWDSDRSGLVLVPGPNTVWARCDLCQEFVNPREIVAGTLRPAGWKEAYGGTCRGCMREESSGEERGLVQ